MACRACLGCKAPKSNTEQQPSLREVLRYQNHEVVARLEKKLNLTRPDAVRLFKDVRRFMYLCSVSKKQLSPSHKIDQGWHEFILYTKDYAKFCEQMFGRYMHHQPESYFKKKPSDTSHKTRKAAKKLFGKLSPNWESYREPTKKDMEGMCKGCIIH